MPDISVIIPCFNAEHFIREAIESVLQQTHCDFEIIVVDDGSTDGSRAIVESIGPTIGLVCGPNLGASAARNRGTRLAKGEFIQYLDADDVLAPDALARRVE